jgi:hypothetical protein
VDIFEPHTLLDTFRLIAVICLLLAMVLVIFIGNWGDR